MGWIGDAGRGRRPPVAQGVGVVDSGAGISVFSIRSWSLSVKAAKSALVIWHSGEKVILPARLDPLEFR